MGISITLTIPTPRRRPTSASRRNRRHHQDPSPSPPPDSAAKHERPRRPRRLPRVPACIPCLSVRVRRTSTTVPSSNTTASSSSTTSNPQNPRPSPTATLSSPPASIGHENQQEQKQVEKNSQNQVENKQVPIISLQPTIPPPPSTSPPPPIASTQVFQQTQQTHSNRSATPPPQPPALRLSRSSSSHATSARNPSNPDQDQDQTGIEPEISSQLQSPNQTALDATQRITNITNNDLFTDTSRVAAIASITASATAAAVTAAFRSLCPDLLVPLTSSGTSIQNNDQSNLITNNPNSIWQRSTQRVTSNNTLSLSRWRNNNLPDNSENQDGPADSTQRSDLAIFINDPRNGSSIEIAMRPPNRAGTVVEISMRPPNRTAATDVSSRSSSSTSSSNAASTAIPESDDEGGADQDNDGDRSESNFSTLTDNENPKQYMQRMRKESPNKCVKKGLDTLASSDMFNPELISFVVQELEELLSSTENSEAEGSPSQIDPPLRITAHHDLAEYFHSESKSNREKVLHHCRTGLVCLPGCENKLPTIAAEMHCLYAEELAKDVPANQSLLREVIEHTNSAKAALYVEPNSQLSYRIALVTGQVYATRWDEPICDNLVSAYESYHSALEIIKFSVEDRRDEYLRIGCYCVDFILRFLRHQRQAKDNPKSVCNHSKNTACTKDLSLSPVLPHFNIEHALEFANKLRTVLNQCIDAEDESRDSYPVAEFKHGGNLSAIHERLARCYLEKSEHDKTNAAKDLAKSSHHLRRALGTYHEQKDLAMRYTFLHDLMTEVEQKQEQVGRITSGLTSNDSDTNSEDSFQATSSAPQEQGSENGDKEENKDDKPEEDDGKDKGEGESKENDAVEPESAVEELQSETVEAQETSSETR